MITRKLTKISEWFSAVEFLILRASVCVIFLYELWRLLSS